MSVSGSDKWEGWEKAAKNEEGEKPRGKTRRDLRTWCCRPASQPRTTMMGVCVLVGNAVTRAEVNDVTGRSELKQPLPRVKTRRVPDAFAFSASSSASTTRGYNERVQ